MYFNFTLSAASVKNEPLLKISTLKKIRSDW